MNPEEEIKKLDEKQKIANLQIEKRLVSLETGLENVDLAFSRGDLSGEQEKRVESIEDKVEMMEDQLMIMSIDTLKIKEEIHRAIPEEKGGIKDVIIQNRRINEIENMLKGIESGGMPKHLRHVADADLKKEFESFRAETEENVDIIVDSIKKILSKMK